MAAPLLLTMLLVAQRMMAAKDVRLSLMTELLAGLRGIKMMGLEGWLADKVRANGGLR